MNGGAAKTLRFRARCKTSGQPERQYQVRNKSRTRAGTPETPGGIPPMVTPPGTFELVSGCARAVYQRMKREANHA